MLPFLEREVLFDPRDESHFVGSTSSGRRLPLIQLILAAFVSGLLLPSGIMETYHRGGSNGLASVALLAILGFAAAVPIGLLLVCFPKTRGIGVAVASVGFVAVVGVAIRLWVWNLL